MLYHLHIRNFTIIDDLELDLTHGMTILTGETGAGKSIVIDAIDFALGQRITSDILRTGSTRAEITLSFDVKHIPPARTWLGEQALDNDNECLVRRLVGKDGRSKSFINNTPVTLSRIRELASLLINIHGQHEFQTLIKPPEQRRLLDQYAGCDITNTELNTIFKQWQNKQIEYDTLLANSHEAKSRTDYLRFQLDELTELNITLDELNNLEQEQKRLSHSESLLTNCQSALQLLSDEDKSASKQLTKTTQHLEAAQEFTPALKDIISLINSASIQTDEASSELQHFLNEVELSPERLHFVEERLSAAYNLARKHRVDASELAPLTKKMQTELDQLNNFDASLATIESEIKTLHANYKKCAAQLSEERQKTAKILSKQITDNMQTLGMPGGIFSIGLEKKEFDQPQANGMERIHFLVSANPGQKLQPLAKVASGGELSRISLAVQVITTSKNNTPTLVFDEIDVGIGGATADIVGSLLRELAEQAQVFCITHLAQVAAKGHQHLRVEKQVQNGKTRSTVVLLNKQERIKELARMSGGSKITKQALAHAEEMLCL